MAAAHLPRPAGPRAGPGPLIGGQRRQGAVRSPLRAALRRLARPVEATCDHAGTMSIGDLIGALNAACSTDELRRVLGDALGDRELEIAYWLPTHGVWVDDVGRRMDVPEPGPGATVVERGGAPVAMLMHAPSSVADPTGLAPVMGAAALALENARLQVDAADAARGAGRAAAGRHAGRPAPARRRRVRRGHGGDRPAARRPHREHGAVRRRHRRAAWSAPGATRPGRFVPVGAEIRLDSPTALAAGADDRPAGARRRLLRA